MWEGWLPIFLPYPWFADERDSNPKLPHPRLAEQTRNRLVANLVSQFPKKDYAAFVAEKRQEYVVAFRAKVEERLASKDWQGAKMLCDGEKSDAAFVRDARARAEKIRIAEVRAEAEKLFKNEDWKALLTLTRNETGTRMHELYAWAESRRVRVVLNEAEALQGKKNWEAIVRFTENETAPELVKIRENAIAQIRKHFVELQNGVDLVDFIKSTRKRNLTRRQLADRFSLLKGRYVRVKGFVKDVWETATVLSGKPFVSIRVQERELDDGTAKQLLETVASLAIVSVVNGEDNFEDLQRRRQEVCVELTTPSKIDIQFNVTEDARETIRRWSKNEKHTMRGRIVSMGDVLGDAECDESEVVE